LGFGIDLGFGMGFGIWNRIWDLGWDLGFVHMGFSNMAGQSHLSGFVHGQIPNPMSFASKYRFNDTSNIANSSLFSVFILFDSLLI
jgi:hypothetical protein